MTPHLPSALRRRMAALLGMAWSAWVVFLPMWALWLLWSWQLTYAAQASTNAVSAMAWTEMLGWLWSVAGSGKLAAPAGWMWDVSAWFPAGELARSGPWNMPTSWSSPMLQTITRRGVECIHLLLGA